VAGLEFQKKKKRSWYSKLLAADPTWHVEARLPYSRVGKFAEYPYSGAKKDAGLVTGRLVRIAKLPGDLDLTAHCSQQKYDVARVGLQTGASKRPEHHR
jgi:hypothetical protein